MFCVMEWYAPFISKPAAIITKFGINLVVAVSKFGMNLVVAVSKFGINLVVTVSKFGINLVVMSCFLYLCKKKRYGRAGD